MKKIKYLFDEENEKTAVLSVDLVENPANGVEFITMSDEAPEEVIMSSLVEEQKIAVGPVLIPGKAFGRKGGRSATMDAKNIRKAMENFMIKHNDGKSKIHHLYDTEGVHVIENWIVDKKNGKMAGFGFDHLPDGTWMQTQKFSDEIWEKDVKSGEVKGFSIAANLIPEEVTMNAIDEDQWFDELLK